MLSHVAGLPQYQNRWRTFCGQSAYRWDVDRGKDQQAISIDDRSDGLVRLQFNVAVISSTCVCSASSRASWAATVVLRAFNWSRRAAASSLASAADAVAESAWSLASDASEIPMTPRVTPAMPAPTEKSVPVSNAAISPSSGDCPRITVAVGFARTFPVSSRLDFAAGGATSAVHTRTHEDFEPTVIFQFRVDRVRRPKSSAFVPASVVRL